MRYTRWIALAIMVSFMLPAVAAAQSDDDNPVSLGDVARKMRQAKAAQQIQPAVQAAPAQVPQKTVVITPPEESAPALGDVARELRRERVAPQMVAIDNDNLTQVMQEAERNRQSHSLLYKFEKAAKVFQVSFSPDMNCSMSFNANAAPMLGAGYVVESLPELELEKLDGPAVIDGNLLQVSVHNGSHWNLREITVGVTLVRQQPAPPAAPQLLPAVSTVPPGIVQAIKNQDLTVLYHIKGMAAPASTTVFKAALDAPIGPDQEWHWGIVDAKGVPAPPSPDQLPSENEITR